MTDGLFLITACFMADLSQVYPFAQARYVGGGPVTAGDRQVSGGVLLGRGGQAC